MREWGWQSFTFMSLKRLSGLSKMLCVVDGTVKVKSFGGLTVFLCTLKRGHWPRSTEGALGLLGVAPFAMRVAVATAHVMW